MMQLLFYNIVLLSALVQINGISQSAATHTRQGQTSKNTGRGPCNGITCSGLFQIPIPPSCECMCPRDVNRDCPANMFFDESLCECFCREFNPACPGQSSFDFDVCTCVCPLQQSDCASGQELSPAQCSCITPPPPPTTPPPTSPPPLPTTPPPTSPPPAPPIQPPPPTCPPVAAQSCKGRYQRFNPSTCTCDCLLSENSCRVNKLQQLNSETCQCECTRFNVRYYFYYPYYSYYYPYYNPYYYRSQPDTRRSIFKRSNSGPRRQGPTLSPNLGFLISSCPQGKYTDISTCTCYL